MSRESTAFIPQLETVIRDRLQHPSAHSYTQQLASAGVKRVAQKLGEEAIEVALASVAGDRDEVIDEAADLIYHLLVLLQLQDIRLADVADVLERRHRASPADR